MWSGEKFLFGIDFEKSDMKRSNISPHGNL